jgi:two-component system sensor histidine kinase AlgZ
MNTIASLTRTDPRAAEQAVEDLADLFRASMGEARNLVSFAEEFDLVRGYLNIETFRLGSRLRTDWDLETLPAAGLIPLLTLQPLVENAIYHGIEPLPEGGVIKISATCDDDHVNISISNPLAGTGHSGHRGNQLAQENVKARLVAHFAGRGGLAIDTDGNTYRVTVKVPIE